MIINLYNGVVVDKNHYYTKFEMKNMKDFVLTYHETIKQNKKKVINQKIDNLMKRR